MLVRPNSPSAIRCVQTNKALTRLIMDNCQVHSPRAHLSPPSASAGIQDAPLCWQIEDTEAQLLLDALSKSNVKEFSGYNNCCLKKELRAQMRGFKK